MKKCSLITNTKTSCSVPGILCEYFPELLMSASGQCSYRCVSTFKCREGEAFFNLNLSWIFLPQIFKK